MPVPGYRSPVRSKERELRNTETLRPVLPDHLDGHAACYPMMIATNEIRKHMRSFFQVYHRYHIGQIILECGMKSLVVYRISEYLSFSAGQNPYMVERMAFRANDGGRPAHQATLPAFLKFELVISASFPEGSGVCIGDG